jgi:hypothetical protein
MRLLGSSLYALVFATGCLIALPACGGGGAGTVAAPALAPAAHSPAPGPVTTPTAGPAGFAPVSFAIALPKAGSSASVRKALFVPPPTTTITVSVNSTTAQTFACTSSTCSGSFLAPAGGQVNFFFGALDVQGNLLAAATLTQTIAANGTNVIPVTLEGVIHRHALTSVPPGLSSAASGTATVTAVAFDDDGDLITGTYFAPLVLSVIGDTTGTVAVTSATLASDTATGTVAYTYSAATAYVENHVRVAGGASSETTVQLAIPFEVGRTFYTFTPTSVVGFAPGATSPTRTIPIAPAFNEVSALACDGTNLYIDDGEDNNAVPVVYGFTPAATSPSVAYTSNLLGPVWVAAYGGGAQPGNRGQLYIGNTGAYPYAITGFQGAIGGPPFAIPPNSSTQGNGFTGRTSLEVDGSGKVYAALYGASIMYGGYEVRDPTLNTVLATGQDDGSAGGSNQIAIDTTVTPARIYSEEETGAGLPEIAEYDNYANVPTHIYTDNDNAGLFVDGSGNIYTSSTPGNFHIYPAGQLSGTAGFYALNGQSVAFDSAGYVYVVNAGAIMVYQPGSSTVFATFPGTTYGTPAASPSEFGTFCR